MTTAADRSLRRLETFAERKGDAARLARLASLAVRAEPHLLRDLRRKLLPDADVGVEADLWFSPIVESRGVDAIVLDAHVVEVLREDLAADGQQLREVVRITAAAHRSSPQSILLEEQLNGLALLDEDGVEAAIDEALRPALRTLREGGEPAREIAHWAMRALPRFHPRVRRAGNALALLIAASAALGARRLLRETPEPGISLDRVAWALPAESLSELVPMGITLVHRGVRFLDPGEVPSSIELPRTDPLLVGLSWERQGERIEILVEPEPGRTVDLDEDLTEVVVRTLAGDEYALREATEAAGEAAAEATAVPEAEQAPAGPEAEPVAEKRAGREPAAQIDVFLSHGGEDRERAQALARILEAEGLTVWADQDLIPGQKGREAIEQPLGRAGKVVVLWSRSSVGSLAVREEAALAADGNKLIPVLLEDVEIPLPSRRFHHLDLRDWKGGADHPMLRQLLAAIADQPPADGEAPGGRRRPRGRSFKGGSGIYLSYRRSDSAGWARRIYESLSASFGPESIFLDVDSVEPGDAWQDAIARALAGAGAVLALIGPDWLSGVADPADHVRREIAAALQSDLVVIPILLEGARMPPTKELPPDLEPLARRQVLEVDPARFDEDMERLTRALASVARSAETPGLFDKIRSFFRGGGAKA